MAKFSPNQIIFHDKDRHIRIEEAEQIIAAQDLPIEKLTTAIESKEIIVYEFNEEKYVDRLDLGRVFYIPPEKNEGISVERFFTDGKTDPLERDDYESRHLAITDDKGNAIFEMVDATFPRSWDNVSAKIVAQKYFFKPFREEWKQKLKEKIGRENENSIAHLTRRVSNFFADEGERLGYFTNKKDRDAFRDELAHLQINRMAAFNSPVQFNAGIFNEYGIKGSHGINYWKNPKTQTVQKISEGEYTHPQCHACFIKGPKDDLESIAEHGVSEIGVFASGSGIGQGIDSLRSDREPLSGGGWASGPMSFFKYYDTSAGTVKSGGKSRRAARMTTSRQSHPDIMDFIRSKVNEDRKALVLMKAGYSAGMDGEAYTTVAYQNTNISVRLDDHFFKQVESNGEIDLKNVTDGEVARTIPARQILKEISFGSWRVGDPGVQFEDKIQEMHTCPNSGRQNSTNPCGEYCFLDDTSCNLASLNLLAFSDDSGNFDVVSFEKASKIISVALDIANNAASYPVRSIAAISPEFRTIGLGFANLGALLMRKGMAYDSDEGRALAAIFTAILTGVSYETSTHLAEKLGSFIHFEFNRSPMLEVMKRHQRNLRNINYEHVPTELRKSAGTVWKSVIERGSRVGFRNAQATVIAPTGTISYLMGCDTTGAEPSLSLMIFKELSGGGNVTLVNREVPNALSNLGYTKEEIKGIEEYISKKGTVIGSPHLSPAHYKIFNTSFGNVHGEGSISFQGHVEMVAAIQPFVSGGISKTNNLPSSATVREVYDAFILGHGLGLKGMTVFRNDSKPISALNFGGKDYKELKRGEKEYLTERRQSFESEVKIANTTFHVIVGEYPDGRPGQITFLSFKEGSTLGALLKSSGVQASRSLKRGVGLMDVADGWIGQEFEPKGLVSGHPYIKTANSPLDFAAKFLKLEYLGEKGIANDPSSVEIENLRGYENGAIRTYKRMRVDEWDIKQVLNDPELGGFKDYYKHDELLKSEENRENKRGVVCRECGHIMAQTSSNCYECRNCAEKVGGCGF